MLESIIIISLVILLAFIALRCVRFVFNFLKYLYISWKYRVRFSKTEKKSFKKSNKTKKKFGGTNDFLERSEEKESNLKILEAKQKKNVNQIQTVAERKIVGIAKPKGMWTAFVTQQKMSWLSAMVGSKQSSDNFWQNMIEAQQQAQGKFKGKQR